MLPSWVCSASVSLAAIPDTGPECTVCSASVEFSCAMPPELWLHSIGLS